MKSLNLNTGGGHPRSLAAASVMPVGLARRVAMLAALAAAALLLAVRPIPGAHVSQPAFLTRLLGAPSSTATMPDPGPGAAASVTRAGLQVTDGSQAISLGSPGAGDAQWRHFTNGVTRGTAFGSEVISVAPGQVEEFATVDSHLGAHTWSWKLDAGRLVPRLGSDGAVGFLSGHRLADIYIKQVSILNAQGRDITPAGLRWSLAQRADGWWLQLRLDDTSLATPYVIDPGIVLRSALGSSTGGAAVTAVVLTKPAGVALNDLLVAQVTFRGTGATATITPPASWTLIRRDDASNTSQALYYHVATGAEPASYTWTLGAANRAAGGIIA